MTSAAEWSSAAIAEVLGQQFGLQAVTVSALGGEIDQNSAVELRGGSRVVVKVSPPRADPDLIRWQHELLRLAGRDDVLGPVQVPTMVPARNGDTVVSVDRDGSRRSVTVQTWMPGTTLSELGTHSTGLLTELGSTAARLVRALTEAPDRPGETRHHWDLLRAPEAIAQGIDSVEDRNRIAEVRRILSWFTRALDDHQESLPASVVHHDLNDFNVLARRGPDGRHHVHAVLDFADALHTAQDQRARDRRRLRDAAHTESTERGRGRHPWVRRRARTHRRRTVGALSAGRGQVVRERGDLDQAVARSPATRTGTIGCGTPGPPSRC